MNTCSVDDCNSQTTPNTNYCRKHYKQQWRLQKLGRTEIEVRISSDRWVHQRSGYIMIKQEGKLVYEHRVLAERALGKPLPSGAVIHHTGAPDDNHGPFKLVICPNQEYHMLLHKRMEEGYGKDN